MLLISLFSLGGARHASSAPVDACLSVGGFKSRQGPRLEQLCVLFYFSSMR